LTALTVAEVLRRTTAFFEGRGLPSARLDAELLLAHSLSVERITLYTDNERPLTASELEDARALVARRAAREPVAYITGARNFRRLNLKVTPDVLVPRPETEHLVEWALEVAPSGGSLLDWGTGSGAVAIALAGERSDLTVTALDVSHAALAVARENDSGGQVKFIHSDGFAALDQERFDVIVANPPYLTDAELSTTEAAELAFEPSAALASGPTGYEAFESIIAGAFAHLGPGGWLLFEVGDSQASRVEALMTSAGFGNVQVRRDLAGVVRNVGGNAA
jgi:release factor glutamine methyltransferase